MPGQEGGAKVIPGGGSRAIALVTLLAFACATAHPPAQTWGEPPAAAPRVALATPELELWMEGTRAVEPAEAQQTLSEARTALAAAVQGRGLDATDPEALLVVRAKALARTGERKTKQVLSVVGVVVVVAAVIIAIVATSGRSSSRKSSGPHAAVPVGGGPVAPWRGPAFAPRPYPPPPPIGVSMGFSVWVPLNALPDPAAVPSLAEDGTPAPIAVEAPDAWMGDRGWMDGDLTELTLQLVDAQSGAVRWSRTVQSSANPRDAKEVSALLDEALADQAYGHRVAPLGAAPVAP